jgi:putative membrane protein
VELTEILPHVNASLNGLATCLLVAGYVLIKQKKEVAHKWTMLGCFGVSILFLASYLTYHGMIEGHGKAFPSYPGPAIVWLYRAILIPHIILAAAVPFLAVITIYHGLKNNRQKHLRIARWTFPIGLYVSVTGVLVYLMLYQLYPPLAP